MGGLREAGRNGREEGGLVRGAMVISFEGE